MTKKSQALISEMLEAMTRRYVLGDKKIPQEMLAIKDEIMEIFAKMQTETDPAALEMYEKRLTEIHEVVFPGQIKP